MVCMSSSAVADLFLLRRRLNTQQSAPAIWRNAMLPAATSACFLHDPMSDTLPVLGPHLVNLAHAPVSGLQGLRHCVSQSLLSCAAACPRPAC